MTEVGREDGARVFELSWDWPPSRDALGDILKGLLLAAGLSWQDIVERQSRRERGVSVYCSSLQEAMDLKARIEGGCRGELQARLQCLGPEDWRDVWKRAFQPFALTDRFEVVPAWMRETYRPNGLPVYIDTSLAFGTGLHETTRFMAEFIDVIVGRGVETFLDVGTGTGLLAILARKTGVKKVKAIDISPEAIETARGNGERNQCADITWARADIAEMVPDETYDYVAANLVTHDLMRWRDHLLAFTRPGGYLAVSGIAVEHLPPLRQHFETASVRCEEIRKGSQWSACLYRTEGRKER